MQRKTVMLDQYGVASVVAHTIDVLEMFSRRLTHAVESWTQGGVALDADSSDCRCGVAQRSCAADVTWSIAEMDVKPWQSKQGLEGKVFLIADPLKKAAPL